MGIFNRISIIKNIRSDKSTNLEAVRHKIVLMAFFISALVCLIMSVYRIIDQRFDMLLLSIIALSISLIFFYLSKIGYSQITLRIASIIYTGFAFYEGLISEMPPQTILYFTAVPVINIFLMSSKRFRIFFIILNLSCFNLLNFLIKTVDWSNTISFMTITIFCFIIILFFIQLLENQQELLQKSLADGKQTMMLLNEKHQETLLFNNMMNHDIKAPLRTIKGFTSLLKKGTNPSEKQLEYINFISASTENLEKLIFDMLTLSKINTIELEFKEVNLNDLINKTRCSLSYDINEKGVKIDMEKLPNIAGNKDILGTVFQNIICNSIKYQPKLENHIPAIQISHKETEDFNLIYIQDNGIGIKPENVNQLFDPFVRFHSAADYEGTGLGMTICKKIMEKHNGTIKYIANENSGTCFELSFPKV